MQASTPQNPGNSFGPTLISSANSQRQVSPDNKNMPGAVGHPFGPPGLEQRSQRMQANSSFGPPLRSAFESEATFEQLRQGLLIKEPAMIHLLRQIFRRTLR